MHGLLFSLSKSKPECTPRLSCRMNASHAIDQRSLTLDIQKTNLEPKQRLKKNSNPVLPFTNLYSSTHYLRLGPSSTASARLEIPWPTPFRCCPHRTPHPVPPRAEPSSQGSTTSNWRNTLLKPYPTPLLQGKHTKLPQHGHHPYSHGFPLS